VSVFGGGASGVEVELALFFGEEFAFESEALLLEADEVEAMGDAREDVDVWGVAVAGEVVTGVSEFDFYVLVELFGIRRGKIVEFVFSQFLGVAAATFGFVKAVQGGEVNLNAETFGARQGAAELHGSEGSSGDKRVKDFVELIGSEDAESAIRTYFHRSVIRVGG
jgi:hypothetical protein